MPPPSEGAAPPRIRRLMLSGFRNYRAAELRVDAALVALIGPNGAGKTNILEAASLLAPGRGLHRATHEQIVFHADGETASGWAVSAEVEGMLGLAMLGTGRSADDVALAASTRQCRIDREPVGSAAAFSDHLRLLWLTPAMDGLFNGPAGERRRFLDRLVLALDAGHGTRVSALDRSLRARNRLLSEPRWDEAWLAAVEHETAEIAVAVAAQRVETVTRLQGALLAREISDPAFPAALVRLDGWLERALQTQSAAAVEDQYRALLADSRPRDAAAGRTLEGTHLSDLAVTFKPKGVAAAEASTGEQKALLISLVLAHAALITEVTGAAPVLLLDEVVAHLDPARRQALFDTLARLGCQVWMTGADPSAFAALGGRADFFEVKDGTVGRQNPA